MNDWCCLENQYELLCEIDEVDELLQHIETRDQIDEIQFFELLFLFDDEVEVEIVQLQVLQNDAIDEIEVEVDFHEIQQAI